MSANPEGFQIQRLDHVEQVVENWPFLKEGLDKMNEIARENKISAEVFLQVVLDAAMKPFDDGQVLFFSSKNGKPLLYVILINVSNRFTKKLILAYACYSNSKSKTVTRFALDYCAQWAKAHGYDEMVMNSYRISGSAFYLFEKKWGFRRQSVQFSRAL